MWCVPAPGARLLQLAGFQPFTSVSSTEKARCDRMFTFSGTSGLGCACVRVCACASVKPTFSSSGSRGSVPVGSLVPAIALSPPMHTQANVHAHAHTQTGTLSHTCTLNNLAVSVYALALSRRRTRRSTLHINKDKNRNGQCKAPRGTKLLQGDQSRVAVCSRAALLAFTSSTTFATPFAS